MPFCMVYLIPETNQLALVDIVNTSDTMITISSKKIINPKSDNLYTRTVSYREVYDTIPLSYETITNNFIKRDCTSSKK